MKIAVRYCSKTGNTKKIADEIAKTLGVDAVSVETPLQENIDILFLGSAVYAAGVDQSVKDFIKDNASKIGKIVNFSTAALLPSTYKQVKQLAEANNVAIAAEEFHCRGEFTLMHKGHPNAEDLKAAVEFAKNYR